MNHEIDIMETFYEKKPSEIATIYHKATLGQPKNHPHNNKSKIQNSFTTTLPLGPQRHPLK